MQVILEMGIQNENAPCIIMIMNKTVIENWLTKQNL